MVRKKAGGERTNSCVRILHRFDINEGVTDRPTGRASHRVATRRIMRGLGPGSLNDRCSKDGAVEMESGQGWRS